MKSLTSVDKISIVMNIFGLFEILKIIQTEA